MLKKRKTTALCSAIMLVVAGVAPAQNYDLSWYTIDGGGVMFSSGGTLELSGTIGQPDASVEVLTGGNLELVGGFWPVFCFGDLDGDEDVDLTDLAALLAVYGTTCP